MSESSTAIAKSLEFLNPGPLDKNRGPYSTLKAAYDAIPNVAKKVDGVDRNLREGKFVDIGTEQPYVAHWWKDGYEDADLVPYIEVSGEAFNPIKTYVDEYLRKIFPIIPGFEELYSWGVIAGPNDAKKVPLFLDKEGELGTYAYPNINETLKDLIAGKLPQSILDYINNYLKQVLPQFDFEGYAFGVIDMATKKIPLGVSDVGKVLIWGEDILEISKSMSPEAMDALKYINPSKDIVGIGNSLVAGAGGTSFLIQLSNLLNDGRTYTNTGIGGDTSTQISFRQGGKSMFFSVPSGYILASGDTSVIPYDSEILQTGRSVLGFLNNIPGLLIRAVDGSYLFRRTIAGTAERAISKNIFSATGGTDNDLKTAIIWIGRNNFAFPDAVMSDLDAVVAFLKPLNKRFIVLSEINGNYPNEFKGKYLYDSLLSLNDRIRAKYPRNYLEVREVLIRNYNASLPQDVIDFGNDIVPSSLRTDNIHLNTAGYGIVAQEIYKFIKSKNW